MRELADHLFETEAPGGQRDVWILSDAVPLVLVHGMAIGAFILALGTMTSFGALGMGVTTGSTFGLTYVGTIAASFALIVFFAVSIRGRAAFARSRRWPIYIASWFFTYGAAIAVVAWVHGSVLWSGVTSGAILAVTMACASYEARR